MDTAYALVRWLHVAGGAVGLLLVPVPLAVTKGSRIHRAVGKVFVIAMAIAGASGLLMAASWLVAPTAFRTGTPASVRASGLFLGTIALITLSAVQQMVRSTRRKRGHAPWWSPIELVLPVATVVAGIATIAIGLLAGRGLLLAFGGLAVFAGTVDLRFTLRPLRTRMAWWYQHMQASMVAVIAALTAFLVFGGRRWLSAVVPEAWGWVLWIAPALVIVPILRRWIASYRRRFRESG